ncbi:MAG: HD domain-containing protein [Clostridia bacterium]|nr:HD domain-containing protein [Clostridia bacterium]
MVELKTFNLEVNIDVCIISAYWHDIGRTKLNEGHEKLSAEMLKEEMKKQNYGNDLINECYKAIENHKWNMQPQTKEGLIVKDADKLAWLGIGRWKDCLNNNQNLDLIINGMPKLKSELLYFNESREIYDREIIKLIKLVYSYIKDFKRII